MHTKVEYKVHLLAKVHICGVCGICATYDAQAYIFHELENKKKRIVCYLFKIKKN